MGISCLEFAEGSLSSSQRSCLSDQPPGLRLSPKVLPCLSCRRERNSWMSEGQAPFIACLPLGQRRGSVHFWGEILILFKEASHKSGIFFLASLPQ